MSMRSTLAVLVLLVCGCEPMSGSPGFLEAHADGVVSQAARDGSLFAAEVATGSSQETADQPPEVAEPVEVDEGALSPSPETETVPASVLSDEALGGVAAASPPVVEDVPDELSSGEYGSGAVVSQQQVALPSDAVAEAVPESDQGTAEAAPSSAEPVPASTPESDESFASPLEIAADSGSIDISALLPSGPVSDQFALDALEALPRRSVATLRGAAKPCIQAESGLLSIPLGQLSMVRAWLDGTLLRAELRGPAGRLYTVVRGDRVGSDGGRVLQLSSTEVVVGEIGFGLDGSPFIVQEAIRARP